MPTCLVVPVLGARINPKAQIWSLDVSCCFLRQGRFITKEVNDS